MADAPTENDKIAMRRANLAAHKAEIPSDGDFETFVVGHFVNDRHRYIDERFYDVDFGRPKDSTVRLTKQSREYAAD